MAVGGRLILLTLGPSALYKIKVGVAVWTGSQFLSALPAEHLLYLTSIPCSGPLPVFNCKLFTLQLFTFPGVFVI